MHLLEAALAWAEQSEGRAQHIWTALADELVALCLAQFIDPVTGALHEHFDSEWRPMPGPLGERVEPGHQFEWAWLLMRWARHGERAQAGAAAQRLLEIGETEGVDRSRGVAVNALGAGLRVTDGAAKVWPQTERIKAWHAAQAGGSAVQAQIAQRKVGEALQGLTRYLLETPAGLWHEHMNTDGGFALQPCRASSLYHIVCAIDTLQGAPLPWPRRAPLVA
jgi:mannose-6-phosphate isomerase